MHLKYSLNNSVKFLGQIFSKDGISINKNYAQAILDMPNPANKQDIMLFLGMVKFVGKFIPNVSKITASLRNLTKEDVAWHWNNKHEIAIKHLKILLTNSPILTFLILKKKLLLNQTRQKMA